MMFRASIFPIFFHYFGKGFFSLKKEDKEKQQNQESEEKNMLCRFVVDSSGKKIGETVAVDNDIVIIKANSQFMGVPLRHIQENGKTMLVKGLFDYAKAYELGETWRKNSARNIDEGFYGKRKKDRF